MSTVARFDVAFDAMDKETGDARIGIRKNKFAEVEWAGLKWR